MQNLPAVALRALVACAGLGLAACAPPPFEEVAPQARVERAVPGYGRMVDQGYDLPAVPAGYLQGVNHRAVVPYAGSAPPGTIEIDPYAKFLYWVEEGGTAIRYPIAVGREGKGIHGTFRVGRKAEWPGWTPTPNMLRTEPEVYERFRDGVPGGPASPLGARALYLYSGSRDTYYRIHGTNDWSSIGSSGSAGCIRLFNQDAIDLFERAPNGATVRIRSYEESVAIEGPLMATRGVELPPYLLNEDGSDSGQRPPVPQAMIPEEFYLNPAAQAGVAYMPDATDVYPTRAGMAGGAASDAAFGAGGAGAGIDSLFPAALPVPASDGTVPGDPIWPPL